MVPPDVSDVNTDECLADQSDVSIARQSNDNEQPMGEESVNKNKKSLVSQISLPRYIARRSRSQSVDRSKRKGTNHSSYVLPPN